MRARAYCTHPSMRDHWALRSMSRCPDQVVSLKRNQKCLSPQASLKLIYRPTAGGMKGWVDFPIPRIESRTCGVEEFYILYTYNQSKKTFKGYEWSEPVEPFSCMRHCTELGLYKCLHKHKTCKKHSYRLLHDTSN
ncbi:hypothetical protein TNCV_2361161 [Trichonephila clavipes]|nr:hypothetical protein TNCV_2361161 [Trichonephila clavipes]